MALAHTPEAHVISVYLSRVEENAANAGDLLLKLNVAGVITLSKVWSCLYSTVLRSPSVQDSLGR